MKTLIKLSIFVFFLKPCLVTAEKKDYRLICNNANKSILLEFFIKIGKVVGQKSSSFILFEDKYAFLGVDFAWHLDKNTMKLKPVLLSEGTIRLKKMPEELSCSKLKI